jgi:signal transduction histidine kinase
LAFDENAQELVTRMAERAASAIQNARLYSQVIAANNAKSEFVSLVAHELKVPMTSIRGYASMIEMTGNVGERERGFVRIIENNVDRMRVMVEDLNDISRIESGHLNVDIEVVELDNVLQQAKEGVMTQIQERGHTLIENIDNNLPAVYGNASRLIQVLVNLLSNAYKYTPNNGEITFSVRREDDKVWFSVKDNGIGMTEDQVRRLGTKFFRADHEHVQQQSGTGLGFAITRNLIELMGSDLHITSALGKGSEFSFALPLANEG